MRPRVILSLMLAAWTVSAALGQAAPAGDFCFAPKSGLRVGDYKYTQTAGNHVNDIVGKGGFKGELARPYMNSPHTVNEIISTGKGIADPGGIPGALRYDVPGNVTIEPELPNPLSILAEGIESALGVESARGLVVILATTPELAKQAATALSLS